LAPCVLESSSLLIPHYTYTNRWAQLNKPMRALSIIFLLFVFSNVFAQSKNDSLRFNVVEEMPYCQMCLEKIISEVDNCISEIKDIPTDTLYVKFTIDSIGNTTNMISLTDIDHQIEKVIHDGLINIKTFCPATRRGKPINCEFTLGIYFDQSENGVHTKLIHGFEQLTELEYNKRKTRKNYWNYYEQELNQTIQYLELTSIHHLIESKLEKVKYKKKSLTNKHPRDNIKVNIPDSDIIYTIIIPNRNRKITKHIRGEKHIRIKEVPRGFSYIIIITEKKDSMLKFFVKEVINNGDRSFEAELTELTYKELSFIVSKIISK